MIFGVSVMFVHQMIAYILFMLPVYVISERIFGVHETTGTAGYFKKVTARLVPGVEYIN